MQSVTELEGPVTRGVIVGVRYDQESRLDSKEALECFLEGWTEQDLAEAEAWTHLSIQGRRYRLLSPMRGDSFRMQLD